jgi:hypothetical protein
LLLGIGEDRGHRRPEVHVARVEPLARGDVSGKLAQCQREGVVNAAAPRRHGGNTAGPPQRQLDVDGILRRVQSQRGGARQAAAVMEDQVNQVTGAAVRCHPLDRSQGSRQHGQSMRADIPQRALLPPPG